MRKARIWVVVGREAFTVKAAITKRYPTAIIKVITKDCEFARAMVLNNDPTVIISDGSCYICHRGGVVLPGNIAADILAFASARQIPIVAFTVGELGDVNIRCEDVDAIISTRAKGPVYDIAEHLEIESFDFGAKAAAR